jgi:hypothetical protein
MATRTVTREQAERKKTQAAAFMERIGESDRADEFDDMSVDEYAEHRGLQIANPNNPTRKARKTTMAAGPSKAELQDQIDDGKDVVGISWMCRRTSGVGTLPERETPPQQNFPGAGCSALQ